MFFHNLALTSGKFLLISLDVIVFKALMYFGMFSVGLALKSM